MTGGPDLQHPRFARAYVRISDAADRRGGAAHRDRLLADLTGAVIEVGAGNGRNFPHYPPGVTSVLAVEPDDTLRTIAEHVARTAPVPVTVMAGEADKLPADTASLDAAVVSLVLCSVANPAHALAEIRRVLRPRGQLRFYEHVRSTTRCSACCRTRSHHYGAPQPAAATPTATPPPLSPTPDSTSTPSTGSPSAPPAMHPARPISSAAPTEPDHPVLTYMTVVHPPATETPAARRPYTGRQGPRALNSDSADRQSCSCWRILRGRRRGSGVSAVAHAARSGEYRYARSMVAGRLRAARHRDRSSGR